jgi:hypothetical protein
MTYSRHRLPSVLVAPPRKRVTSASWFSFHCFFVPSPAGSYWSLTSGKANRSPARVDLLFVLYQANIPTGIRIPLGSATCLKPFLYLVAGWSVYCHRPLATDRDLQIDSEGHGRAPGPTLALERLSNFLLTMHDRKQVTWGPRGGCPWMCDASVPWNCICQSNKPVVAVEYDVSVTDHSGAGAGPCGLTHQNLPVTDCFW